MDKPIPENMKNIVVMDATNDIDKITSQVDFVFCAVDMKKMKLKHLKKNMLSTNALLFQITAHTDLHLMFLW